MNDQNTGSLVPARAFDTASDETKRKLLDFLADYGFSLAVVFGHIPMVMVHFRNLWLQPHYQFFPLLLVMAIFLVRQRGKSFWRSSRRYQPLSSKILMVLGSLLAVVAFLVYSPWLAMLALLVTSAGVLRLHLGAAGWSYVWPAWALGFLLLPPPYQLDLRLAQALQLGTAEYTSLILESLGVKHLIEGTILELKGRVFLVEEACSGIQSLLAIIASAFVYAVYRHGGIVLGVLLVATASAWAISANVIRVVIIAVAYDRIGLDLSDGWRHELLGGMLFLVAIALLLSTEQLMLFLFGPINESRIVIGFPNWCIYFWDRFIAISDQPVNPPNEIDSGLSDSDKSMKSKKGLGTVFSSSLVVFGIVQVVFIAWLNYSPKQMGDAYVGPEKTLEIISSKVDEDFFEECEIEIGLERVDFEIQERSMGSDLGRYSRVWTYNLDIGKIMFAFDYPFPSYHELMVCYRNTGWQLDAPNFVSDSLAKQKWDAKSFAMRKETGECGHVYFSHFDGVLTPVSQPNSSIKGMIIDRLRRTPLVKLLLGEPAVINPDCFQFQILYVGGVPLSKERQLRVQELYFRLRKQLTEFWQAEMVSNSSMEK